MNGCIVDRKLSDGDVRLVVEDLEGLVQQARFLPDARMIEMREFIIDLLSTLHSVSVGSLNPTKALQSMAENRVTRVPVKASTSHRIKALMVVACVLAFRRHNSAIRNTIKTTAVTPCSVDELPGFPPFGIVTGDDDTKQSVVDFRNAIRHIFQLELPRLKVITMMAAGVLSGFQGALVSGSPTTKIRRRTIVYTHEAEQYQRWCQHHSSSGALMGAWMPCVHGGDLYSLSPHNLPISSPKATAAAVYGLYLSHSHVNNNSDDESRAYSPSQLVDQWLFPIQANTHVLSVAASLPCELEIGSSSSSGSDGESDALSCISVLTKRSRSTFLSRRR